MAQKNVRSIIPEAPVNGAQKHNGAEQHEQEMVIDELRLLKLTRFMEKERAARMELVIVQSQLNAAFQEFIKTNEQAKQLNDKFIALQEEQKTSQDGYQKMIAAVAAEFKIDMNHYSFDDETGVLHKLPTPPENQGQQAEAKA